MAQRSITSLLQRSLRRSSRPSVVSRSVIGAALGPRSLLARSAALVTGVPRQPRASCLVSSLSAAPFSSAASVAPVAIGDRVSVQLSGKLSNGDAFGQPGQAVTFVVGGGQVIPGVEEAVVGLSAGETKSVVIAPEKAFGKQKHLYKLPRQQLNLSPEDDQKLAVGQVLQMQQGEHARIVAVSDDTVEIDLAHPLAGETLHVDLTLVEHVAREQLSPAEQLVVPEEISPGDNETFPQRGDTLVMHYVGKLAADGKVFDSSRDRGTPFQFQIGVGQVIKGWDEGVLRMSKGQQALLRIPSAKGYGRAGAGGVIPPDADLLFEVELLDILRPSA
ncbi:hypothetical protein ATCC90586_004543 [Pythium insidiosum]|nr:hypothetical protein ATCC90586_004543 [Pythium insidiosum]